jgi:transposase
LSANISSPASGERMGYIEGIDRHQQVLFPEALDDYVAADHPVRVIDEFVAGLDLAKLGFGRATPAAEGRPGYDPRALLSLFIYGYLNRVRSSRRLEAETHRNLEVIWLMRKLRPDHKTISEFRRQHTAVLKKVTKELLLICRDLELLDSTLVLIDGSKIRAVNSRERNYTAVRVEKLLRRIDESIAKYLADLDRQDRQEQGMTGTTDPELPKKLEKLRARQKELQEIQEQVRETGNQVSLTDPESRRMKMRGDHDVCYNAQIAVDPKHHLIVAHDVTNEVTDVEQLAPMALAAKEALEVEQLDVAADRGYHNGADVVICEENKITPYVPAPQTSRNEKAGLFTKEDFTYSEERDAYRCPAGHWLQRRTQTRTKKDRVLGYYSNAEACRSCPMRSQCTTSKVARRIMRTPEEVQVEAMRRRVAARPELMARRKAVVEHPFGTIKREGDAGHFLLKGLQGVGGEFSLSVLAYNLKRVMNTLGVKCLLEALRRRISAENRLFAGA